MKDDGEDGTWQLVVHLHTDTSHSHTGEPGASVLKLAQTRCSPAASAPGPSGCAGAPTV